MKSLVRKMDLDLLRVVSCLRQLKLHWFRSWAQSRSPMKKAAQIGERPIGCTRKTRVIEEKRSGSATADIRLKSKEDGLFFLSVN